MSDNYSAEIDQERLDLRDRLEEAEKVSTDPIGTVRIPPGPMGELEDYDHTIAWCVADGRKFPVKVIYDE